MKNYIKVWPKFKAPPQGKRRLNFSASVSLCLLLFSNLPLHSQYNVDAVSWPDAQSVSAPASGIVTVCMGTGHECDFSVQIAVSQNSGSALAATVFFREYGGFIIHQLDFTNVAGNGTPSTQTIDLDAMARRSGGYYNIEAHFSNGTNITSQNVFMLANNDFSLTLNGERFNDGIVASTATTGGCNGLTLKARQYTCDPNQTLSWTLSVCRANFGDYSTVSGTTKTAALTSTEVTSLKGSGLDLKAWYIAKGGTWTNHALYNIYMIATGTGGLWADNTVWLSHKVGPETYVRDFADQYMWMVYPKPRYLVYPEWDKGYEQNRFDNANISGCLGYNVTMYESPDLWNTYTSTNYPDDFEYFGYPAHLNPDYINPGSSNANYAYTKVNNRMCENLTSEGLTVRMFWTRARTGEKWPKDWLYNMSNNFVKDASGTNRQAGCEITISGATSSAPHNANSAPISLSAIPGFDGIFPGSLVTAGTAWYPPNPTWYSASNGSMSGNNNPVICLLTRINEHNSSNDPVVFGEASTSLLTNDIDPYIRWNNNAATRNTELVNELNPLVAQDEGGGLLGGRFQTAIANNPTAHAVRICFRNLNVGIVDQPPFSEYGEIQIGFTNALWNNWTANGSLGDGFEVLSPTLVRVSNYDSVCFDSITLGDSLSQQIGARAVYYQDSLPTGDSTDNDTLDYRYAFTMHNQPPFLPTYRGTDIVIHWAIMAQSASSNPRGEEDDFQNMGYKEKSDFVYKQGIGEYKPKKPNGDPGKQVPPDLEASMVVFPNPANEYVEISITNMPDVKITLMNALGDEIGTVPMSMNKANVLTGRANVVGLSKGIYLLRAVSGDEVITKKIVVH